MINVDNFWIKIFCLGEIRGHETILKLLTVLKVRLFLRFKYQMAQCRLTMQEKSKN